MNRSFNKSLIALLGAVILPLAALVYLANLPGGGRGSLVAVLLQVGIVIGSVVLFAIFLARVVHHVNAGRVRRWLDSAEGREWLDALPEEERAEFLDRLAGEGQAPLEDDPVDQGSAVDSSDASR